ncbi:MAG: antibiotic biosynthesis monooxygenase, partial [Planctomycetes bacterium]|nr:antibiotic biosynthesis monooxygenase [Planctomycetota bacterium]
MVVTCVHVRVREGCAGEFAELTAKNHERSVLEPGNLRFDVLQSRDEPARFMLYEAYATDE